MKALPWHLLTPEEYQKIWDFQEGKCAICRRPLTHANVDHVHWGPDAGLIRGFLCMCCNRALGIFRDLLDLVRAAVSYLEDPPATRALGHRHYGLPGRVGTKKQRRFANKIRQAFQAGKSVLAVLGWKGDPTRL